MKQLGALARTGLGSLALFVAACGGNVEDEAIDSKDQAVHAWGDYHWARTTASFDLITVNSLTSDWDLYLTQAVSDWSGSSVLNLVDTEGDTGSRTRRKCNPPDGQVRVCNLSYGNTGWLGVAGIYADSNGHIVKGYTKLNDTYFSSGSYYDSFEWRQMVTCQEVGHNLGLAHQDEDFNNGSLFSCMDYQDPPYAYPNAHDYEQLVDIYTHLDSTNSYDDGSSSSGGGGGGGGGCNAPPGVGCNRAEGFGESLGRRGRTEQFVKPGGDGTLEITTVTWAD